MALSVLSRVHGLSEADWERIPQGAKPSLDFELGCNGSGYVQVEAKGSSVPDNTGSKGAAICGHAASIRGKKASLHAEAAAAQPASVYGSIGVIDSRKDGVMRCWLLDPAGSFPSREARQQQVLNRLTFIAELMEAALPPSLLTMDIYRRLELLQSAADVFDHDKVQLGGTVESFEQAFFFNRTQDLDKQFSGVVIPLRDGSRFFYGIRKELWQVAHSQDCRRLLELNWEPASTATSLLVVDSGADQGTSEESRGNARTRARRPKVERAHIHTTSSGRVFGLIGAKPE